MQARRLAIRAKRLCNSGKQQSDRPILAESYLGRL
jgi:hypothetical protein